MGSFAINFQLISNSYLNFVLRNWPLVTFKFVQTFKIISWRRRKTNHKNNSWISFGKSFFFENLQIGRNIDILRAHCPCYLSTTLYYLASKNYCDPNFCLFFKRNSSLNSPVTFLNCAILKKIRWRHLVPKFDVKDTDVFRFWKKNCIIQNTRH